MALATNRLARRLSFQCPLRISKSLFSAHSGKPPAPPTQKRSASSSAAWNMATLAVVGGTFVVIRHCLTDSSWRYEEDRSVIGPVKPQAQVTSRVFLDVSIAQEAPERIVIGLFGTVVPKTVHNFECLCRGHPMHQSRTLSYTGSTFHRIIPGFMIQGGDFTRHDGTGGSSVYGDGRFDDENFHLRHTGPGILSMANSGPNTSTSQFFITTARTPHLDGRHVVFGVVQEGWEAIKKIEACGSSSGKPSKRVEVVAAGVLKTEDD